MPRTSPPDRPHLLALAAIYAGLVSYGSLVPLEFQPLSAPELRQRLTEVLHQHLAITSKSDFLVNLLLLAPWSFLLMGALCADRRRSVALAAAPAVFLACVTLAAGMEFVQFFFPPRVSSLHDIVAQSLGCWLGIFLWCTRGQSIVDWCRRLWQENTVPGLAGMLLPAYAVLLVLLHLAPFDVITRPRELWHKWQGGRIQLLPFYSPGVYWHKALENGLQNFVYFLPVGLLWGLALRPDMPAQRRVWRVVTVGLAVCAGIETLQLVIYSRAFSATDVCTGMLGVLSGAQLVRMEQKPGVTLTGTHSAAMRLAIAAFVCGLAVCYWRPFDFQWNLGSALDRLAAVNWLPLADYEQQPGFSAVFNITDKTLLFLPLGLLLTLTIPVARQGRSRHVVFLAVFATALLFECGQLFLPTRYFGVTDILIETFGGWLGCRFAALLVRATASPAGAGACVSAQHAGKSPLVAAPGKRMSMQTGHD